MLYHIVLFKLKPEVTPEKLEQMMRQTRARLLKISEVLSLKCGKNIDPASEWAFFIAMDFESSEKLALYQESAIHRKYVDDIIRTNTTDRMVVDFETDPGKNVQFS